MSYETRIGWRYLYRGGGSRAHLIGLLLFFAMAVTGGVLALVSSGGSGWGIILSGVGLMGTVLFGLLWVFSVFTTVSVLGVVLGVAAMTLMLAITSGFQQQFQDKVLGVNAHVIITKSLEGFDNYREIEEVAWNADDDVIAVQPFLYGEMQATRGMGYLSGVSIKGVDPQRMRTVLDVDEQMTAGTVDSLERLVSEAHPEAPILIGQGLAKKLKAKVGDMVTILVPPRTGGSWRSLAEKITSVTFEVTGVFYSGFADYDQQLMYLSLTEFQKLMGWGDRVIGVEIKVRDVNRADEIAEKIDNALGGVPWVVVDWRKLNHNLFAALTLQKIVLVIVLTLIIGVATFNMVSALTMMVTDKTSEIAILRSMGATSIGVGRVFQTVGLCIGAVGTTAGLVIGLTLCDLLRRYDYRLDPEVYMIDRLPVTVNLSEVIWIVAITMTISAVATWFPSTRAAAMSPVDGLRYD